MVLERTFYRVLLNELYLGFAEEGRFVDGGSVRKEKGADQDIGLEGLPQNWHFLTLPEHFLAARGHSHLNPDGFGSSVPAYNPMGASRIVSAKKHSGKVSKCSALLYELYPLSRTF